LATKSQVSSTDIPGTSTREYLLLNWMIFCLFMTTRCRIERELKQEGGYTKLRFTCLLAKDDRNSRAKRSHPDPSKTRTSRRKARFCCNGLLIIKVYHEESRATVNLSHDSPHIEYTDIEIPDRWKEFIKENINSMPSRVCGLGYLQSMRLSLN
jgi:hypothetical protein